MINPLPVSAGGLLRRDLVRDGSRIAGASLFPMFDRDGRVQQIIMLTADSTQIVVAPWKPGLLRVPLWGSITTAVTQFPFRPTDDECAKLVTGLWHFDPWWMLTDERYAGQRTVELLKSTNCAGRFGRNVTMVYYRRDLSRASSLRIRGSSLVEVTPWKSELLPPPPALPAPEPLARPTPMWRLDPIWQRRT